MAKAFAPAMQAKKYGRIIAISTECAMQNWPTQAAYTSGKRGMDAVLRVLAKELGPDGTISNLRVSQETQGLSGVCHTNLFSHLSPAAGCCIIYETAQASPLTLWRRGGRSAILTAPKEWRRWRQQKRRTYDACGINRPF